MSLIVAAEVVGHNREMRCSLRRLWARCHTRWPLLRIVVPFLVGQLLTFLCLPGSALVLLTLLGLLGVVIGRSVHSALLLSVGIASALVSLPPSGPSLPVGERHLLLHIESLRHRQPGRVDLTARAFLEAHPRRERLACRAVDLPWRNAGMLREGAVVAARVVLQALPHSKNPFSFERAQQRQGIVLRCRVLHLSPPLSLQQPWWVRVRAALRAHVEQQLGEGERSGLLLSAAFGMRDVLSFSTEEIFRRTGVAHLLVVSGYHVSIVSFSLYSVTYWLLTRAPCWRLLAIFDLVLPLSAAAALSGAIGYVVLCGAELSGVRALTALTVVAAAGLWGRSGNGMQAMLAALLLIHALVPGALLQPGVQLTFAALVGLQLAVHGGGGRLRQAWRAVLLAGCATGVVSMWWFGQLSLIGFVVNLVIAPVLGVLSCAIVPLALIASLLGVATPLMLSAQALLWARDLLGILSAPEWVVIETEPQLALLLSVLLFLPLALAFYRRVQRFVTEEGIAVRR